jgi:hypothetical protein
MIVYTVHEPGRPAQSIEERADSVVFVKEGFTWWGFLFGPLWLLFNWLWLEFIATIVLSAVLVVALSQIGLKDEAPGIINLLLMLLIGFEGNDLRRWKLARKGYAFLASVAGQSAEECERRFFDAWLPQAAAQPGKPLAGKGNAPKPPSGTGWHNSAVVGTFPSTTA